MFPSDSDLETKVSLESEKTGVIDEPPFQLLLLGDWGGDADKNDLSRRRALEIDRDNFDDLMKRLRVRVDLEADGGDLSIDFQSLDDFHPDEIFQQVPMFADLRDLRRRLMDSNTFNLAAREVRQWNTAAAAEKEVIETVETEEPADNLLDAILSKPGGGAAPPKVKLTQSTELSNLISDLMRPHLSSVDENEQANLVAAVDSATAGLMRNIIQHEKFRKLEAAWRGLFLLVNRTETASDLKIFILDVTKDELGGDLKTSAANESLLYNTLIADADEPWTAVFADFGFEPNVDDIASLIRIGKMSAEANAPFISQMRPAVLGIESLADHPNSAEWNPEPESNEAKLWAALRGQPEAAYLGMTMPRFLARLPYGKDTDPLETFVFEEFADEPFHDGYLWANSAFAVALLLAQTYSAYGWDLGRALMQDIERMPTHIYTTSNGTFTTPGAEVQLSQASSEWMMEHGLMPLVSFKDSDRLRLTSWQSISDPFKVLKGRW